MSDRLLGTLEKILETDEVWFSNPLFMNDFEEVRFGVLRGVELIHQSHKLFIDACGSDRRALTFETAFDFYFKKFDDEHAFDTYVFCLSEHNPKDYDGMLSMWRGYGGNGNGAAIVFDAGQIAAVERSPLVIARVHYGSNEERIDWLDLKLLQFTEILHKTPIPEDKLYIAAHRLFERIMMFALFSKHRGFAEEREWRIVYVRAEFKGSESLVLVSLSVETISEPTTLTP